MKKLSMLLCLVAVVALTALVAQSLPQNSLQQVTTLGFDKVNARPDWPAARDAYARWQETGTATPAEKEMITEYLHYGRPPLNRGPLDNTGGPDAYGYYYVDNQGGDTATFSWIELCGDGNATNGPVGDDADLEATIGWNFPFYGGSYGSVFVCTNGFMRFGEIFDTYDNPCPLETQTDEPGPLIAPYWDDLYALTSGGCTNNGAAPWVRWRNFNGEYFVVEWSQIPHFSNSTDRYSFEAILYPNGNIKFQYNNGWNDSANPTSASIGIDDQSANNGLAYQCDDASNNQITGGRAIWFYLPAPPCANFQVTAPGAWSGNTCGAGNDCDARGSEEHIYAVTIPQDGLQWIFTTCDATTDFDSYLFLMTDCCGGTTLTFNDDNCGLSGHDLNSTFVSDALAAGTYYLVVEAFGAAQCGNYTLRIEPACVSCQPGDQVEVVENVMSDTTFYYTDPDGGCNSTPNAFWNISFDETVCGLGFTYTYPGDYRDTDWYQFTVAQAESVTVSWWSEFPKQMAIVDHANCTDIQLIINVQTDLVCEYEYAFAWLPAGTYALFFSPSFGQELNILDSMSYRVTLSHGVLSADESVSELPSTFALNGNYPNPFNPETRISFALPRAVDVKLAVYDITGRLVTLLTKQRYEAGNHELRFDGSNLPSGLYFTRLDAAEFTATQKMVLLK